MFCLKASKSPWQEYQQTQRPFCVLLIGCAEVDCNYDETNAFLKRYEALRRGRGMFHWHKKIPKAARPLVDNLNYKACTNYKGYHLVTIDGLLIWW